MVTRNEDRQVLVMENFKGGEGRVVNRVILPAEGMYGKGRIFNVGQAGEEAARSAGTSTRATGDLPHPSPARASSTTTARSRRCAQATSASPATARATA